MTVLQARAGQIDSALREAILAKVDVKSDGRISIRVKIGTEIAHGDSYA
jgi:hypothetical protein